MIQTQAAARSYARALYKSSDNPENLLKEIKQLLEVILKVSGISSYLECPRLTKNDKNDFIKLLENSLNLNKMTVSLLKILIENERFDFLHEIVVDFENLVLAEKGMIKAYVSSATALDKEEQNNLQAALEKRTGKKLLIEYEVDESLISGIRVEVDNKIFDASLSHRITALKDSMRYKISAGEAAG